MEEILPFWSRVIFKAFLVYMVMFACVNSLAVSGIEVPGQSCIYIDLMWLLYSTLTNTLYYKAFCADS